MKYKSLILLSLLLIFLSGCKSPTVYKQKKREIWQEHEARLYDVPIMLNAQPGDLDDQGDQFMIAYTVHSTLDEVQTFYLGEMERLGWQLNSFFEVDERLLVFEKPSKMSAVSLRSDKDRVKVVIFYRIK